MVELFAMPLPDECARVDSQQNIDIAATTQAVISARHSPIRDKQWHLGAGVVGDPRAEAQRPS